jgi:DNA-binding NarL/FixJ family response regulator
MPLRHIQILDSDPTAALVTQLGLQARLKTEAEITIATFPGQHERYNDNNHNIVDLLIVDPGAQSQAAASLVKTLKTDCPHTPMVILTAYDSPLLRSQMRLLGVEHYLAKPIDLFEIEQVVRHVLETAQSTDAVA